jgi:hypothetical protein
MAVRHEGFFLLTYPFYRIMLILEQRRRAMAVVMMKEVGSHIFDTTVSFSNPIPDYYQLCFWSYAMFLFWLCSSSIYLELYHDRANSGYQIIRGVLIIVSYSGS